jgi:hypothetical protein
LADFIGLLKAQMQHLGSGEKAQPVLFAGAHPNWVAQSERVDSGEQYSSDSVLRELLPHGPEAFPGNFQDKTKMTTTLDLPAEPISVVTLPGGKHVVQSDFGFRHDVRNPTEGNFICYAQLRGVRAVPVPTVMFDVFKAVKAYENYLRDLRQTLLRAYERKSGHRPMAEHQTRETFKFYGLPWIE